MNGQKKSTKNKRYNKKFNSKKQKGGSKLKFRKQTSCIKFTERGIAGLFTKNLPNIKNCQCNRDKKQYHYDTRLFMCDETNGIVLRSVNELNLSTNVRTLISKKRK